MEKQLMLKLAGSALFWLAPSVYMVITEFRRGYLLPPKPVYWRLILVAIGILSIYFWFDSLYHKLVVHHMVG
jgi:hypothetical protein